MSKSTRASIAPDKVGVNFTLHSYDYDRDAERVGLQAAEALGIEPRRLLKTLMVEVDGKPACASVVGQRPTSDVPFVPARGTPRRSRCGDPELRSAAPGSPLEFTPRESGGGNERSFLARLSVRPRESGDPVLGPGSLLERE
jgi:hypothetical protein